MKLSLRYSAAVVAVSAFLVAVPAANAVTVRVETAGETFSGNVSMGTGTFFKDGNPAHTCSFSSAAGALEIATGGAWTGTWFSFGADSGYFINTIRGAGVDPNSQFWTFWVNNRFSEKGICAQTPGSGDELLFYPDCFASCPAAFPTEITGVPSDAQVGKTGVVRAVRFQNDGSRVPAAGATIEVRQGPTVKVNQANSNGEAAFDFPATGEWRAQVRFTPGFVRSREAVFNVAAASTSASGSGGSATTTPVTTTPGTTTGTPTGTTPGISTGAPTSTIFSRSVATDEVLVTGTVGRHRRFSARGAPSRVSAVIDADPRSVRQVKFRLGRRLGKRCWYFSGSEERFRAKRCTGTPWFRMSLADATEVLGGGIRFEQELGGRLPRGRYVFDVKVQGQDGRYTALERGRTREVFFVGTRSFRVGF